MSIATRIENMTNNLKNAYNNIEDLGIDLTNTNKNLENLSTVLEEIYENYPKVSGTGTDITLNNTAKGKMEIDLKGNTSQVSTTGKNLLNPSSVTQITTNGITFTPVFENNKLQYININGTATDNAILDNDKMLYTTTTNNVLNGCIGGSSTTYKLDFYKSGTLYPVYDGEDVALPDNTSGRIRIVVYSGTTINNVKIYPMIRLSSVTDATYEPYTGGAASPNPDYPQDVRVVTGENIVKVVNKNLFNKNDLTAGFVNADGTVGGDLVSYRTSNFILVKPNTTYYKTQTGSPRTKFYDKNKQVLDTSTYQDISVGAGAGSFTTPNEAYYLRFSFPISNYINTIQIEENLTATTYEEHKEQDFPISLGNIELCKIGDYKDYIYKNKGSWYLHKEIEKVMFDGSNDESWAISATNTSGYNRFTSSSIYNLIKKPTGSSQITDICSNYFIKKSADNTYGRIEGISVGTNGNLYIYADISKEYTLEQFKTWLSTHNTIVYYMLAIPTDIEITDTTLINQLEAIYNTAKSYKGQTHIFTITEDNNVAPILDATALLD